MNTIQAAFSSPRFNRLMFGLGAAVLAAGVLVLVSTVMGGSDKTSFGPEAGFHPTLPAHSEPLKNADGKTVRTFGQLDPIVRSNIRTFLATAVARKHLEQSWAVIAPSVKTGYTYQEWKNARALPVIPYPIADVKTVQYYLDYASTREILIEVGVAPKRTAHIRPATFQLGLSPVGKGVHKQWLVDYWMPRWTPPLPEG
jgi:hypothetical protein